MSLIVLLLTVVLNEPTSHDLYSQIGSERLRINTIQLTLTVRSAALGSDGELLPLDKDCGRSDKFKVWKTPDSIRIDLASRFISVSDDGGAMVPEEPDAPFESRLAITNGTFMEYHPRRYKNIGRIAARTGKVESDESVQLRTFDPVTIGTIPVPYGLWYRTTLSDVVPNDSTPAVVETVTLKDGTKAQRTKLKRGRGLSFSFLTVPSKGGSVIESELIRDFPSGGRYRQQIWVTLQQKSSIWFPQIVRYSAFRDDHLIGQEEWQIEDLVLNEPVAERTFTYEGLEVDDFVPVVAEPAP